VSAPTTTAELASASGAVLARFRRQRPLRAGSLLITIFGDAIAPRGGAATLSSLIRLAAPFGVNERLVRTTVARLAQDGWLANRRDGRLSEYRLSPAGRRRFSEATRRIYATNPETWSGTWTLVLLPPAGTARDALRRHLQWLGFGQLEPGMFAHATLSPDDARRLCAEVRGGASATVLAAAGDDAGVDRRIAGQGWDLRELAGRYRRFVRDFEPLRPALAAAGRVDPELAFVVRTLLVHEFRKVHLRDPLLPESLLPGAWIGIAAYDLCRELYAGVFQPAERHLSASARRLSGPLARLAPDTFTRFGGLRRS
jgi:phenylacetic acid degradation operon negative regulatory protein